MKILTPNLNPSETKGRIEGLKQFAMSTLQAIFGLWDDSNIQWADNDMTWGAMMEYPSVRARIGQIKRIISRIK